MRAALALILVAGKPRPTGQLTLNATKAR